MMIKPVGNYVLIRPKKLESKSEGGIILPEDLTKKEQAIESTGEIIAFGPTAFKRWNGCESPQWFKKACEDAREKTGRAGGVVPDSVFNQLCEYYKYDDPEYPPWEQWGLKVGDIVEHKRYDAKDSVIESEDGQIYRYIPDIEIIGVVE